MTIDDDLAQRLREAFRSHQGIAEKSMVGGLIFISHFHVAIGFGVARYCKEAQSFVVAALRRLCPFRRR